MIGKGDLLLAAALTACTAGIGGFAYGTRVGVAQEQAAQLRAIRAAADERDRLQGENDASGAAHQAAEYARQSNVREIIHESHTITERPVYSSVCVDADGVGLLDRAAATANGEGLAPSAGIAISAPEG